MYPDPCEPLLRYFAYEHLPEGLMRETSKRFHELAHELYRLKDAGVAVHDDDQCLQAMHKLLEAKDCAVRSVLPLRR